MRYVLIGAILTVGCSRELVELVNAEDLATGAVIVQRQGTVIADTPELDGQLSLVRAGSVVWVGQIQRATEEPWRLPLGPVAPDRYEVVLELSSGARALGALRSSGVEIQLGALNEITLAVTSDNLVDSDEDGFFDAEELADGDPDDPDMSPTDAEPPSFGGLTAANGTGPGTVALLWMQAVDRHDPQSSLRYRVYVTDSGTLDSAVCDATNEVVTTGEPQGTTVAELPSGMGLSAATAYKFAVQALDTSDNISTACDVLIASTSSLNSPPELTDIADSSGSIGAVVTVDEAQPLSLDITASDPDGDPVTLSLGLNALAGSLTSTGAGTATFTVTPDLAAGGNFQGSIVPYLTEFVVSDGQSTDRVLIQINVRNLNLPPRLSAADDLGGCPMSLIGQTVPPPVQDGDVLPTFVVQAETESEVPVFGVDCDGDAVQLSVISSPLTARVDNAIGLPGDKARGTLVVRPEPGQSGTYWVLLRASQPDLPDSTSWIRARVAVIHHRPPQALVYERSGTSGFTGVAVAEATGMAGEETVLVTDAFGGEIVLEALEFTAFMNTFAPVELYDDTVGELNGPRFPVVGNFDPGGGVDVVVVDGADAPEATPGPYSTQLFYSPSLGTHTTDGTLPLTGCAPVATASANIDVSATDEVLVACRDSTNLSLIDFATGASVSTLSLLSQPAEDIRLLDVDGNGTQDLITADAGGVGASGVTVWTNDGLGSFTESQTLVVSDATASTAIAVGDVNGDGDDDIALALATNAGADVQILVGNGSGTFTPGVRSRLRGSVAYIELVEVTGDGLTDLVVAPPLSNASMQVYFQARDESDNGTQAFIQWQNTDFLFPATVNGLSKGTPYGGGEVAIAAATRQTNMGTDQLAAFIGVGGAGVATPLAEFSMPSLPFLSFDIMDSPNIGLVARNDDSDRASELLMVSSGRFCLWKNPNLPGLGMENENCTQSATSSEGAGIEVNALVAGDLDLDQIPEIVALEWASGTIRVFNADDVFTDGYEAMAVDTPTQLQDIFALSGTRQIALEDYDGDGLLDLWATGSVLQIYRGQRLFGLPTGTFEPTPVSFSSTSGLLGATIADLDADGLRDVVGLSQDGSELVALSENGASAVPDGMFSNRSLGVVDLPSACDTGAEVPALRVGNFNGDEAPDVALYVLCPGSVGTDSYAVVMLGTVDGATGLPTGVFTQREPSISLSARTGTGAFLDANRDGRLDLVAILNGESGDLSVHVWDNDGSGALTQGFMYDFLALSSDVYAVAIADFDGDGTNDVALAAEQAGMISRILLANPDNPFGL